MVIKQAYGSRARDARDWASDGEQAGIGGGFGMAPALEWMRGPVGVQVGIHSDLVNSCYLCCGTDARNVWDCNDVALPACTLMLIQTLGLCRAFTGWYHLNCREKNAACSKACRSVAAILRVVICRVLVNRLIANQEKMIYSSI